MKTNGQPQSFAAATTFDPGYLEAFQSKMFFEGPRLRRRLTNFFVLLTLSTVIATYGVVASSTASVIGAMIVAPLMGPIMATAAAIVMGSAERVWRSFFLVVLGVAFTIFLSWLLTFVIPDIVISFEENSEITSRISPGLLALLTALASGAAGAYITSREEIADSMGGVAIAISLVPPLCVVGISLNQGNLDAAVGAFLLFVTNFLAILFAGGITFLIVGLGRVAFSDASKRTRQRALAIVVTGILLVMIPLGITTWQAIRNNLETDTATKTVETWLTGTANRTIAVELRNQRIYVTLEGHDEIRPVSELANTLASVLGYPVVVSVRVLPSQMAASGE